MKSLRHNLLAVLPQMSETLASPYCRQRMLEIASTLPTDAVSRYGFEAWLAKEGGRADFLYKIGPTAEQFRCYVENSPLATRKDDDTGSLVHRLCVDWLANTDGLQGLMSDLWLEHDADPATVSALRPDGTFIGLREGVMQTELPRACEVLLTRLFASSLPPLVQGNLERLIKNLPPNAHFFHAGTLPSRPQKALRVCVTEVTAKQWINCLSALFPKNRSAWEDALQMLQSLVSFIVVDFDLWETISPRLGFECYIWDRVRANAHMWPKFFAALIELDLMDQAQADALLQWPGAALLEIPGHPGKSLEIRRLHHAKLTWDGKFSRAKMYFGVEKMRPDLSNLKIRR